MRTSVFQVGAMVVVIAGGAGVTSADMIHIQPGETLILDDATPTLSATAIVNDGVIRAETFTTTIKAKDTLTNNGAIEARGAALQLNVATILHHGVIQSSDPGARIDLNEAGLADYTITGAGRWDIGNGMQIHHPVTVSTTGEFLVRPDAIISGGEDVSLSMSVLAGGGPATSFSLGSGSTVTILQGDAAKPYAGPLSGEMRLVKNGSGTQILTGQNTYSGGTEINGGVLQVDNATQAAGIGDVDVNAGGVLAGSGKLGTTTHVHAGGAIAPGAKKPATLSFFGLYLHEGSELNLHLASIGPSDVVNVYNSKTHVGGATVHITDAGLIVGDTVWFFEYSSTWIVDANGSRVGGAIDASDFTLGSRPAGFAGHFVAESGITGDLAFGRVGFVVTAVPEPTSLSALAGAGLLGLLRRGR